VVVVVVVAVVVSISIVGMVVRLSKYESSSKYLLLLKKGVNPESKSFGGENFLKLMGDFIVLLVFDGDLLFFVGGGYRLTFGGVGAGGRYLWGGFEAGFGCFGYEGLGFGCFGYEGLDFEGWDFRA